MNEAMTLLDVLISVKEIDFTLNNNTPLDSWDKNKIQFNLDEIKRITKKVISELENKIEVKA